MSAPGSDAPRRTEPLLCFRVALAQLAVAAEHVDEIVSCDAPTALPGVPPHVAGIVAVRGEPVPLLDLRVFFGLGRAERLEDREPRVLVVRAGPYRVGLVCDLVSGIRPVDEESFGAAEGVQPPALREHARAQVDVGGSLAVVLDLPRVLEAARA